MPTPPQGPFARVLLYSCVAATVTTAYIPLLFDEALTHPCRKANHGWRASCHGHSAVNRSVVDWAATLINLLGMLAGGYTEGYITGISEEGEAVEPQMEGVRVRHTGRVRARAKAAAFRSGFLGGLMSFSYVIMHGAHISVRRVSFVAGASYVITVFALGCALWLLGWAFGRSANGGSKELKKSKASETKDEGTLTARQLPEAQPELIVRSPEKSNAWLSVSFAEGLACTGFMFVTWVRNQLHRRKALALNAFMC